MMEQLTTVDRSTEASGSANRDLSRLGRAITPQTVKNIYI